MKAWLIVVMVLLAVGCVVQQPKQATKPVKAGPNLDLLAMLTADMSHAVVTVSSREFRLDVQWRTQLEAQRRQRPFDIYLADSRIGAFLGPIWNLPPKGPSLQDLARVLRPSVVAYLDNKRIPERYVLAGRDVLSNMGPAKEVPLLHSLDIPGGPGGRVSMPDVPPSIWVYGGVLFYQDRFSGRIRAYDADSLRALWTWSGKCDSIYFCAAVDNALLVRTMNWTMGTGDLASIDIRDGGTMWTTPLARDDQVGCQEDGRGAIVRGDNVILCGWDTLASYALSSGALSFRYKYSYSEGAFVSAPGMKAKADQVSTTDLCWMIDDRLISLDSGSGAIRWQCKPVPDLRRRAMGDGYSGFGNELDELSNGRALLRWPGNKQSDSALLSVGADDKLVKWQFQRHRIDAFCRDGGRVYANGSGYGHTDRGVWCVDAMTGNLLWTCRLDSTEFTGLAVSEKTVYCCCRGFVPGPVAYPVSTVYAISKDTGEIRWSHQVPTWITRTPVIYRGKLYIVFPKTSEGDCNGVINVYSDLN